jgi:hypothetical protein
MLSSIYSINNKNMLQNWDLGDSLGNGFENHIIGVLKKQLEPYFSKKVRLHSTPKTRDDGKDAIITSNVDLKGILKQTFRLDGKDEIKIFIECKSSNNNRISHGKIIDSVSRISHENIDYYVLVTNTSITPNTYYIIDKMLSVKGIKFLLVDQPILAAALYESEFPIGNMPTSISNGIYVEYQTCLRKEDGRNVYDIFVLYHNLTSSDDLSSQRLLSDRNWSAIEDENISFIVPAFNTYLNKITIIRSFADGIDDLLFSIKTKSKETQVHIKGQDMNLVFETPLFGSKHLKCINLLKSRAKNEKYTDVCCVWGEAGVGKTRVFNELFKELDGQNFEFGFFTFRKNNADIFQDVANFLLKHTFLRKNHVEQKSLSALLENSESKFHRAVFLIDDCHNAPDSFWDEIKALKGCFAPISIILCGRTDYSAGTKGYYSFVQWSEENLITWQLEPLSQDDTKNLVRAIIQRIPQIALDKICFMSRNNPLFIVQFIEYLLELKLVAIVNRNSVGVTNVSTFSSKLYIPEKVQDIYEQRLKHLMDCDDITNAIHFLFILSQFGGKLSINEAIRYFDEELKHLELLLNRKFIQISDDGDITFIHESLLLFFRHRLNNDAQSQVQIARHICDNAAFLFEKMHTLEKGCISLWRKNIPDAIKYFSQLIECIRRINNHSSFDIDVRVHDYLYYIWEIYKNDSSEKDLLEKIIKTKIYISLHHFTPVMAIEDCDHSLKLVAKSSVFKNCPPFLKNSILEQKAHSLINAGFLNDSELILKGLLSHWLIDKSSFSDDTIFDLYDRLCSVYNKFNCKELSFNFNLLSFQIAEKSNDVNLRAIAYLNKGKIHYYNDYELSKQSFVNITKLRGVSERILCASKSSLLMLELLYNKCKCFDEIEIEANELLRESIKGSYAHSIVKLYLLLAVINFLKEQSSKTYNNTQILIEKGINQSIRHGFPTHIWQFYNLRGIIEMHLNAEPEQIRRTFETVYDALKRQDLLYLGTLDLCFGNILALSNIGYYFQSNGYESAFYEKISPITFLGGKSDYNGNIASNEYSYSYSIEKLKKEYKKAKNKQILFTKNSPVGLLRDTDTQYFIPIP